MGKCLPVVDIKVDTVGYLPNGGKRATVSGGSEFSVRRVSDNAVVHTGTIGATARSADTQEELAVIDFSAVTEPGRYVIDVPGYKSSPEFQIGDDIFVQPLRAMMLGLYGQRCNTEVHFTWEGRDFSHAECHMADADTTYLTKSAGIKPSLKGWHDAGDYGKYTVNGAMALGVYLKAWEHFRPKLENIVYEYMPETGGSMPDYLDEAKYQMDWILTMQLEDGSVAHKVSGLGFEGLNASPAGDTQQRYYAPISSAAAAEFVASAAQSARIFAEFDADYAATCLAAARLSWEWLKAHPEKVSPQKEPFSDMQYQTEDPDDRLWAAAEMFETTGEAEFLEVIEKRLPTAEEGVPARNNDRVRMNWDWPDVGSMANFTYALSRFAADPATDPRDPNVVAGVTEDILSNADSLVRIANGHAYGRGIGDMYYWGINGVVVRSTMNLQVAMALSTDETQKAAYRDTALQQLDHVLGRNFYGRSFVTGVGYKPPRSPHHRPSVASGAPWPGLIVGGSNIAQGMDEKRRAISWVDAANDYRTNEVAINWSTAMVYALAGFVP